MAASSRCNELPPIVSGSDEALAVKPASLIQQTPLLAPTRSFSEPSAGTTQLTRVTGAPSVRTSSNNPPSRRIGTSRTSFLTSDVVLGAEAFTLSTSDLGSLIKKSPSGLSSSVQNKSTGASDPRIRGTLPGTGNGSGSHWIPARADLDSALSKFDSRQIEKVTIIPGPYASIYGPGFSFTEIQLLGSPRFEGGPQWHGATDAEYKINGNQLFGQQTLLYGAEDRGARLNIATRDADDYFAGSRSRVPSGYQSQEMIFAAGRDWKEDSIEFSILRLDQFNVVLPGYVFDIDSMNTQGYEITHTGRDRGGFDSIVTEAWYNRTAIQGNAQNPEKRTFFPGLDQMDYVGFTDIDSMSTGYRQQYVLGNLDDDDFQFAFGHDLRWSQQELNEISSGFTLNFPVAFNDRNSPIPKSYIANPGMFFDYQEELGERLAVHLGARLDYARSDLNDDPNKLNDITLEQGVTLQDVLGTSDLSRDFGLASAFLSLRRGVSDRFSTTAGAGYAERAPTLTQLYAAQPFMLMLQNGLNNVTGDPTLAKERAFQLDLGWEFRDEYANTGTRFFHMWGLDYITFENTREQAISQNTRQVDLRFVNTDLATILGAEGYCELLPKGPVTPYANFRVLDGRDRTRNGNFGTEESFLDPNPPNGRIPSFKNYTRSRGLFGSDQEPLPGIFPLDVRVGLRFHDTSPSKDWTIDLSARMVDGQNRVASSLRETATAGFTTWDLRSVFRVPRIRGMVIATGVENMFDRLYREHLDFRDGNGLAVNQPGANFYFGTSLTY